MTKKLEVLARTETNRLKQIHWNPTWNYFKEQAKQALHSEDGARIYAKRKIDVEMVFGRMKGIFGVRRVHVRGRRKIQTEIGFLFMSMNLTKLAKIWVKKAQQNKKNTRQNSILFEFEVTFVWFLLFRASFFPAPSSTKIMLIWVEGFLKNNQDRAFSEAWSFCLTWIMFNLVFSETFKWYSFSF